MGPRELLVSERPLFLVVLTLAAHAGYYTFVIGGDHFEFRVYAHLIPLAFVSCAWAAAWCSPRRPVALAAVGLFLAASWPIPWTHLAMTRQLRTREETYRMVAKVAPEVPLIIRPLAHEWDALEAWLIARHVGMRHQEHLVFAEMLSAAFPPRTLGEQIDFTQRPVLSDHSVGVLSWAFPNVAVIDLLGLNDRVIAHNPVSEGHERMMAHDRSPPAGYVECFRPNVFLVQGRLEVRPRTLTDAEIVACERKYWDEVKSVTSGGTW